MLYYTRLRTDNPCKTLNKGCYELDFRYRSSFYFSKICTSRVWSANFSLISAFFEWRPDLYAKYDKNWTIYLIKMMDHSMLFRKIYEYECFFIRKSFLRKKMAKNFTKIENRDHISPPFWPFLALFNLILSKL